MAKIAKKWLVAFVAFTVAICCAFGLVACGGDTVAVEKVELNKTTLTLEEGETEKLTATVTPDDATDKTVTWTTSDEEVATVANDGTVTAVAEGSATITAKAGGKSATCAVTVYEPDPNALSLTNPVTLTDVEGYDDVEVTIAPSVARNTYYTISAEVDQVIVEDGASVTISSDECYVYLMEDNDFTSDELYLTTDTITVNVADYGVTTDLTLTLSTSDYEPGSDVEPMPEVDDNPELGVGMENAVDMLLSYDTYSGWYTASFATATLSSDVVTDGEAQYKLNLEIIWAVNDGDYAVELTLYAGALSIEDLSKSPEELGTNGGVVTFEAGTEAVTIRAGADGNLVVSAYLTEYVPATIGIGDDNKFMGEVPNDPYGDYLEILFDGVGQGTYTLTLSGVLGDLEDTFVVQIGGNTYTFGASDNGENMTTGYTLTVEIGADDTSLFIIAPYAGLSPFVILTLTSTSAD